MADRRAVPASSEEYSKAIARVAVAQLAERERFSAMQDSAAEVLADILIQYITEVCHSSQSYARHAGRSEFNILDVLLSLDDIGQPLDELRTYIKSLSESSLEFAHTVPMYPILTQPKQQPVSFKEKKEAPPPHIPAWLPAFPDQHTYKSTAVFQGRQEEQQQPRQVVATAKQQAEKALIKLHKRLVSTASLRDKLDTAAAADNPYLRPPEFQVLPAEAAPADTAAAAAADAAAASRAKASGQQPAAKVQKLMPILEGASQQAFSSVIGDAVPEELPEGGIQEYVGWTAVEAEEPVPALSSLDPQAAQRSAAVSFSIKRREDAFAQDGMAGGRRGGMSAARRRAESILAHRSFAMELDERELDG